MPNNQLHFGKINLRPLEPEDLELLYQWENDSSLWQVSNTQAPFSRFILKQYLEESHRDIYETKQLRLIIEAEEAIAVGAIDLFDFDPFHQRAGIGILIYSPANRQKGYAADALQLMCRYAKETLGLHQLYANIGANNPASMGLFEKCGFSLSGTKKDWLNSPAGRIDEHIYQRIL
ncbi:GNAT family N-acetyltransferase [Mangrovibacterium marinum]|uniref:Diamine N-acetyltransferase n=1 Tax=Mangrovibacterium marinum TaxID=1639118 RepID=A0A2T5BZV4_9BACT|nr:GNAT family N-acetyltransferase [Mangrovibacterium marinum]PTN07845.1 diamine N-acetyltransferase [Mangrovibacterium marinum]